MPRKRTRLGSILTTKKRPTVRGYNDKNRGLSAGMFKKADYKRGKK